MTMAMLLASYWLLMLLTRTGFSCHPARTATAATHFLHSLEGTMASRSLLLLLGLLAAALHTITGQDDSATNTWWNKPRPDPSLPAWCNKHRLPGRYYSGKFRPHPKCTPQPPPKPTCPSGKVPVSYVNLLRSNDSLPGVSRTSGPGVWGMMKVSWSAQGVVTVYHITAC
jgi:hypothetical protein